MEIGAPVPSRLTGPVDISEEAEGRGGCDDGIVVHCYFYRQLSVQIAYRITTVSVSTPSPSVLFCHVHLASLHADLPSHAAFHRFSLFSYNNSSTRTNTPASNLLPCLSPKVSKSTVCISRLLSLNRVLLVLMTSLHFICYTRGDLHPTCCMLGNPHRLHTIHCIAHRHLLCDCLHYTGPVEGQYSHTHVMLVPFPHSGFYHTQTNPVPYRLQANTRRYSTMILYSS